MVPPPSLGIGLGLHRVAGPLGDPDAAAYIAAIRAAGATVTAAQATAIDTFIRGEKAGSRWSSIKRLYLPIWGAAAPNAIDMVTRGSGTFSGGVTHGAGFFQGNGSTGYFDSVWVPASGGLTNADAWFGALQFDLSVNGQNGCYNGPSQWVTMQHFTNTLFSRIFGSPADGSATVASNAAREGIFSANRIDGATRMRLLRSSGLTVSEDDATANTGTAPTVSFFWGARNENGTAVSQFHTTKFGAMWMGRSPSGSGDEQFMSGLKTLWETCTGLTIP